MPYIKNSSSTLGLFPTVWSIAVTPDPPVGPQPVSPGVEWGVGTNSDGTPVYAWLYRQPTVDGQVNVPFWKGRLRGNDKINADPGTGVVTWQYMDLKQADLDRFKALHPDMPDVQSVTLDQLIAYSVGKTYAGDHIVPGPPMPSKRNLTPCDWARVALIVDVVCCVTGFIGIRGKINARSVQGVADAIAPHLNDIEHIFETFHNADATALQKAWAAKDLLALIWTGGLAEPIIKAIMRSLSVMDMCLYGTLGLAEISAAFLTDFASVVAAIVAEAVLVTFLAEDALHWWDVCGRTSVGQPRPLRDAIANSATTSPVLNPSLEAVRRG